MLRSVGNMANSIFCVGYLPLTAFDGRKSLVNPMFIYEIVEIEDNLKKTNPNCKITISFSFGCKVYQESLEEVRGMMSVVKQC